MNFIAAILVLIGVIVWYWTDTLAIPAVCTGLALVVLLAKCTNKRP